MSPGEGLFMRRSAAVRVRLLVLSLLALLAFAALAGARVDRAGAVPTDLFISEYIEGSSNNKAIEIFNGTGSPVVLNPTGQPLASDSLQTSFNGGTSELITHLIGTIQPGDVFVVAHNLAGPAVRNQADQIVTAGWFNGNDAISLVKGTTSIDVIGQVGFNPGDGGWGTDPTNTTNNTLRRTTGIEAGDPNSADAFDPAAQWDGFAEGTFDGLGFHVSGGDAPPFVSASSPAGGASGVPVDSNVSITFSEPVATTDPWFSISCGTSGAHATTASGGPTTFTLDPAVNFAQGETCAVAITGAQVADADLNDPPNTMAADHTFSFTTFAPPPEIAEIQGAAHISPKNGQGVTGVEGIIPARRTAGGRGYWIQDPTPDANAATSDAVFVFTNAAPVHQMGDLIRVNGTVSEFRAANDPDNLTITQITSSNAQVSFVSGGHSPPAPTVLGVGGRTPPTENIDDDNAGNVETGGTFDPAGDAIDFYESLEGMILQVNNGALGGYTDPNPERITVDDEILRDLAPTPRPLKAMPDMNVGDSLTSSVVGPLDYSFSNYKIQATATPTFVSGGLIRELTAAPSAAQVAFATFNVENLAGIDPQAKYDHLASLIVNNLQAPDVIGIEEVQDNDGAVDPPGPGLPTDSTVVDADVAWTRLIAAIQAAGGPTYDYRQINPVDDAEGGAPGGNIRVGFLFRTDRGVSFVDRPGGSPTTETTVVGKNKPRLSASPGRIGTQSDAFDET